MAGGTILGIPLTLLGALFFGNALAPNTINQGIWVVLGAVYSSLGLLFVLVSVIILPALRAMRLESAGSS